MPYTIHKSDGTPITVPDNTIDIAYYQTNGGNAGLGLGVQLLGRNAINYGAPVAQNFLQLTENFASGAGFFPSDNTALQGQLWFNKTSPTDGGLWVRTTANTTGGLANWKQIVKQGDQFNAYYADLAERYEADAEYVAGTIVSIGGEKEITAVSGYASINVFGVISGQPAVTMNSAAGPDETHPFVALAGRVPVNVIGKVKKGQRLVSSADHPGVAIAVSELELTNVSVLSIIGRALIDKLTDELGQVLAVVGAK